MIEQIYHPNGVDLKRVLGKRGYWEGVIRMIDIHTHILPGIDDGAKTEADSLEMARAAVAEGIHTIVATPHHKNGVFENTRENILTHTKILNELIEAEGIPLEVIPGQETRINGEMVEDLEKGEILPIHDTKYVFVEFSSRDIPRYTEQLLYDIQVAGYIPIIVHPERNGEIIKEPNKLYRLIQQGSLAQITAGSIIGKFGKEVQKVSHQLIEANLAHFIASDAHNTSSRAFWMKDAYKEIKDRYGGEVAYTLKENSYLLLDGMNVNRYEPTPVRKKRFFGIF